MQPHLETSVLENKHSAGGIYFNFGHEIFYHVSLSFLHVLIMHQNANYDKFISIMFKVNVSTPIVFEFFLSAEVFSSPMWLMQKF